MNRSNEIGSDEVLDVTPSTSRGISRNRYSSGNQLSTTINSGERGYNRQMQRQTEVNPTESSISPATKIRHTTTSPIKELMERTYIDLDDENCLKCCICTEAWEASGDHRLVSLKCGHLFGESCVRRWLATKYEGHKKNYCPMCKSHAIPSQIRPIRAKRVQMLDRCTEITIRQQLQQERQQCSEMQLKMSEMRSENQLLINTLKEMAPKLCNAQAELIKAHYRLRAMKSNNVSDNNNKISEQLNNATQSTNSFSRMLVYSPVHTGIFISSYKKHVILPSFGFKLYDFHTKCEKNNYRVSKSAIRDLVLHRDEDLMAVSTESECKIFDIRGSGSTFLNISVPTTVRSAEFDRYKNTNLIYLGTENGTIYLFDIRNGNKFVSEYKSTTDSSPVINLACLPSSSAIPTGGLLACHLHSLSCVDLMTDGSMATNDHTLNVSGPFVSMRYNYQHNNVLIQTISTKEKLLSNFIIGFLNRTAETPQVIGIQSFSGSTMTHCIGCCTQVNFDGYFRVIAYLQGKKMLTVYDYKRNRLSQTMPVTHDIYDMCPVYLKDKTLLAMRTDAKVCELNFAGF